MRVTLKDVAAHAGVSSGTVSMVLNADPRVAPVTRARVQSSIAELGYIYDRTAASMRKPQSQAVGMIVTQLTNPYFAEFVEGVQAELDARGMDVLLGVTGEDIDRQTRLLRNMSGRRADGIILIPAHGTTAAALAGSDRPLILLARRVEGLDVDYVGGDNRAGARSAVEHLIAQHGCRLIAFVGGFDDSSARQERLAGFLEGAEALGVTVSTEDLPSCPPNRLDARKAAKNLLEREGERPDGILCFNDIVAFGVVDAITEHGLSIGRDIRVIGFDDVSEAASSRPSLSSVAVPAYDAGVRAAQLLLSRVSGERTTTEALVLAAQLRARETCGCTERGVI
jgi:LacI family transcriptional regulator